MSANNTSAIEEKISELSKRLQKLSDENVKSRRSNEDLMYNLDDENIPFLKTVRASLTDANGNILNVASQINQQADKISLVVTQLGDENVINAASIVAAINGDSSISINANRVNLSGYVTITNLSTSGSVEINGGNIKGGTLTLGGSSNINGMLSVLDALGNQVVKLDNTGINANRGNVVLNVDTPTSNVLQVYYTSPSGPLYDKSTTITAQYVAVTDNNGGYTMFLRPEGLYAGPSRIVVTWTASNGHTVVQASRLHVQDDQSGSNMTSYIRSLICGTFSCTGTKSRAANTKNYGGKLLYALETPTPMFEDIGDGETDESGVAYIYFDPVFAECIDAAQGYQAFLQKCGQGDLWVDARETEYFIVRGTPNLRFSWRVVAKQIDYAEKRLDDVEIPAAEGEFDSMADQILKEDENI